MRRANLTAVTLLPGWHFCGQWFLPQTQTITVKLLLFKPSLCTTMNEPETCTTFVWDPQQMSRVEGRVCILSLISQWSVHSSFCSATLLPYLRFNGSDKNVCNKKKEKKKDSPSVLALRHPLHIHKNNKTALDDTSGDNVFNSIFYAPVGGLLDLRPGSARQRQKRWQNRESAVCCPRRRWRRP